MPKLSIIHFSALTSPWLTAGTGMLVCLAFVLPVIIMREKSATVDEVTHLPSGYSYFAARSIQLNPQHPPLVKEICALPLLLQDWWQAMLGRPTKRPQVDLDNEWRNGQKFLFSQNFQQVLFLGRIPAVLLSMMLALVVIVWARRLWGIIGGSIAAVLYVFDPTITAHAQLVTTDVGVACFSVLYLFFLRRFMDAPSMARGLLAGVLLGCALGAKFSALVLIPVTAVLLSLWVWSGVHGRSTTQDENCLNKYRNQESALDSLECGRKSFARSLAWTFGVFSLLLVVAGLFLWLIYFMPSDPSFYIDGVRSVKKDRSSTIFYLMDGELKQGGWKSYFLVAWLLKTPIPSMLLLGISVIAFLRGKRSTILDEAFLVLPALSFFLLYSLKADNIGIRYLIPCFPFAFIFTARIGTLIGKSGGSFRTIVVFLLIWQLWEFIHIAPDHLSYFNQIAGGAQGGLHWLDDSNVDWGQGLIQLNSYLKKHPIQKYRLYYFGTGFPEAYGVTGERGNGFEELVAWPHGTLILSTHFVARGKAFLDSIYGKGSRLNWLAVTQPKAIVGHAYYVYEFQ